MDYWQELIGNTMPVMPRNGSARQGNAGQLGAVVDIEPGLQMTVSVARWIEALT
jgi:hypothetical protein